MKVKIYDAVREFPIEEVNLSEYCTVDQAEQDSGISKDILWQAIHRSRRIGSAVVGNARLVKRADVLAFAQPLNSEAKAA